MRSKIFFFSLIALMMLTLSNFGLVAQAANTTYYVSSSTGNDGNNGLSEGAAFATISRVNSLNLEQGDQVLFRCGDSWHAESLVITESGTAGNRILFGSYPSDCIDKPIIDGTQPISGWSSHGSNIYVADLDNGGNSGLFADGINQLFDGNGRLPMGRWPNINANSDGGYSTINSHAGSAITDSALPAGDWSGARAHIKGMRWYILNRSVSSSSGSNLNLNQTPDCWGGSCTGWGYFLNNHLNTLDQEGEWYYDETTNQVYLYAAGGAPSSIRGSVVVSDADVGFHGGIIIGEHLRDAVHHVTIDNLAVHGWFDHGITTPRNLETEDNSNVIIGDVAITDVDKTGINFATWIWNAGSNSGWRGGRNILVENTTINRANHNGINSYTINSTFRDNTIESVGLIEHVGRDGLGCSITDGGGFCTRDGVGMRFPIHLPTFSGNGNVIQYNRLEKIGYHGMHFFGGSHTIQQNVVVETNYTKGDGGGITFYGSGNYGTTNAKDSTIQQNIVISATGNTDGALSTYDPLFAAGIYLDNAADNITVSDNTIIGSTIDGILVQNSRASLTGNTLYDNNAGTMSRGQIGVYNSSSQISNMSQNILYGLNQIDAFTFAKTVHTEGATAADVTSADHNYYFQPYRQDNISIGFALHTLSEWQAESGMDANSTTSWFTLNTAESPRSRIFYNDTKVSQTIDLGQTLYLDLDQNEVIGSFDLAPFSSRILIDSGEVALAPNQLIFENSSSPAQTITLKNITGSSLQIDSIVVSTGFTQHNDCPATLAAGESCTVTISFVGSGRGVHGMLTVNHDGGDPYIAELLGGVYTVYLPLILR